MVELIIDGRIEKGIVLKIIDWRNRLYKWIGWNRRKENIVEIIQHSLLTVNFGQIVQ